MGVLGHVGLLLGAVSGGGPTDPYFSYVKALLHFDGTNASTTFTDAIGHTFTRSGSVAQLDTSQYKFGPSSLYCDSTRSPVYSTSSDFVIGTGDFTMEGFFRGSTDQSNSDVFSNIATGTHTGAVGATVYINTSGSNGFYIQNNDTASFIGSLGLVNSQWYHLAIVREGTTLRAYLNGVQFFSVTDSRNLTSNAIYWGQSNGAQGLNGNYDECRLTIGYCRYSGGTTFTPPSAAFPDS